MLQKREVYWTLALILLVQGERVRGGKNVNTIALQDFTTLEFMTDTTHIFL